MLPDVLLKVSAPWLLLASLARCFVFLAFGLGGEDDRQVLEPRLDLNDAAVELMSARGGK